MQYYVEISEETGEHVDNSRRQHANMACQRCETEPSVSFYSDSQTRALIKSHDKYLVPSTFENCPAFEGSKEDFLHWFLLWVNMKHLQPYLSRRTLPSLDLPLPDFALPWLSIKLQLSLQIDLSKKKVHNMIFTSSDIDLQSMTLVLHSVILVPNL